MVVVSLESYAQQCSFFIFSSYIKSTVSFDRRNSTRGGSVMVLSRRSDMIQRQQPASTSTSTTSSLLFSSKGNQARQSRARALTRSPRGNPNASKGKAVRSPVQAVEGPLGNQPPQQSRARSRSAACSNVCGSARYLPPKRTVTWRTEIPSFDAGVSADGVWGPPGGNLVALGLPTCQASGVASPRFPACLPACYSSSTALLFSAMLTESHCAAAAAPQNSSVHKKTNDFTNKKNTKTN